MPGSLQQTLPHNRSSGFLAFLRLVGKVIYFKKHLTAFNSQYGHEAPQHLFNSINSTPIIIYRIALKFGRSKNSQIPVFKRFVEIISQIRWPHPLTNEFMGEAYLSIYE